MDIYYRWKEEISKITSFWHFMYDNSVTRNDDNFVDTSHIKQEFGKLYFARLFDDTNIDIPEDFGVFIDKVN